MIKLRFEAIQNSEGAGSLPEQYYPGPREIVGLHIGLCVGPLQSTELREGPSDLRHPYTATRLM